jgi:XRE family transcriptional regulator, aerobic/anaerobic benzoate catabolism transcriptional regulator
MTQEQQSPQDKLQVAVAQAEALSSADTEFLATLGKRVRTTRERRGMTRKQLARDADVSERYLGQLESGEGNISVLLLRRVTAALNVSLAEVLIPEQQDPVETRLIRRFLERLPAHRMEDVIFRLMRDFGHEDAMRRKRVALIGLRGAGKSTLGSMLSDALGCPYIELNREIERDTGLPMNEIMALYGQAGYRRLERRTLERVLGVHERMVLVVGGGLVSEEDTFDLLLVNCYTVWLKATPEDHMARVLAQGDLRPMAGNQEAMQDLRRILEAREPLYRKADAIVETSGDTPAASLHRLRTSVGV